MPRPPLRSTLGGLIESEDDQTPLHYSNKRIAPSSDDEMDISSTPIPRKRGRPSKASKLAEAAAAAGASKAPKPVSAQAEQPKKKRGRPPLKDKANEKVVESADEDILNEMSGTMEETLLSGDELEASMISVQITKPSKHVKASASKNNEPARKPGRPKKVVEGSVIAPKARRQGSVQLEEEDKSRKRRKRDPVDEVPETQAAVVYEHVESIISSPPPADPTPRPARHAPAAAIRRPESVQRARQTSVNRHIRSGSYSDTEGHNSTLRRKVSDLTKKLDSVELRYRNLREVGVEQAEANFKALQRQSEESAAAAQAVIENLKAQLVAKETPIAQTASRKELEVMRYQLNVKTEKFEEKLATMQKQLESAQAEAKSLKTKLAEERAAKSSVESVHDRNRRPSSAKKPAGGVLIMGSAETAQAQQTAQLKIDLYSDLTGLIVRGVKREEEEDVFDCLQTGRNGTLHFKFAVPNERALASSQDEAECHYIPQLDERRDADLMDILPDYLRDEISFPPPHTEKFYARVVRALTEVPQ